MSPGWVLRLSDHARQGNRSLRLSDMCHSTHQARRSQRAVKFSIANLLSSPQLARSIATLADTRQQHRRIARINQRKPLQRKPCQGQRQPKAWNIHNIDETPASSNPSGSPTGKLTAAQYQLCIRLSPPVCKGRIPMPAGRHQTGFQRLSARLQQAGRKKKSMGGGQIGGGGGPTPQRQCIEPLLQPKVCSMTARGIGLECFRSITRFAARSKTASCNGLARAPARPASGYTPRLCQRWSDQRCSQRRRTDTSNCRVDCRNLRAGPRQQWTVSPAYSSTRLVPTDRSSDKANCSLSNLRLRPAASVARHPGRRRADGRSGRHTAGCSSDPAELGRPSATSQLQLPKLGSKLCTSGGTAGQSLILGRLRAGVLLPNITGSAAGAGSASRSRVFSSACETFGHAARPICRTAPQTRPSGHTQTGKLFAGYQPEPLADGARAEREPNRQFLAATPGNTGGTSSRQRQQSNRPPGVHRAGSSSSKFATWPTAPRPRQISIAFTPAPELPRPTLVGRAHASTRAWRRAGKPRYCRQQQGASRLIPKRQPPTRAQWTNWRPHLRTHRGTQNWPPHPHQQPRQRTTAEHTQTHRPGSNPQQPSSTAARSLPGMAPATDGDTYQAR